MNKDDTKQAIIGFMEFTKCITGNKDLKIPEDIAKEYGIEQEPCKDTISRQAVLGLAYDMSEIDGEHFTEPCMVVDVEDIQKLPSVNPQKPSISEDGTLLVNVEDDSKVSRVLVCGDGHFGGLYYPEQEPKTGHWISHYDEDAKEGWYECDRCHTERAFNTDYCPDCGAKMVESQESCDTCKHKDEEWDSETCDGCCGSHSGFEPQESEV